MVLVKPRKKFLLRLDPELWAELEAWAADELRSVNAQIEYVLRQAVQRRRGGRRSKEEPLSQTLHSSPQSLDGAATAWAPEERGEKD